MLVKFRSMPLYSQFMASQPTHPPQSINKALLNLWFWQGMLGGVGWPVIIIHKDFNSPTPGEIEQN